MKANKEFDQIIKDMSLRYRVPQEVLLKVWRSQFELARKVIETTDISKLENFKIIYFRKLGKLVPHKERIFRINKYIESKCKKTEME